ncbi:hypothetical protein [Lentzea jiangxiensis]|uniref:RNA polymerase sigma-70 factor, ECF subfamily n=1 Tax=Lentzea jiangxiensis TaxID=641025 RepID=A0A1H0JK63_9PSEU|nr:hypothetical protein [Lentzea jiangxiensis]SDO44177.1 RNA polymerase sigma-70 factor, ECF subfamily [Lentzea jiangxiensis]
MSSPPPPTGVRDDPLAHAASSPASGLGDLMAAVARGDRTAFGRVYDLLSGPFYRLVLLRLRAGDQAEREAVAEQAALDAWTGVWRDAPQLLRRRSRALTSAEATAWVLARATGSPAA